MNVTSNVLCGQMVHSHSHSHRQEEDLLHAEW